MSGIKNRQVNIRITERIDTDIATFAVQDDVTYSEMMRILLREAITARKKTRERKNNTRTQPAFNQNQPRQNQQMPVNPNVNRSPFHTQFSNR